jgi:hypothetical protein
MFWAWQTIEEFSVSDVHIISQHAQESYSQRLNASWDFVTNSSIIKDHCFVCRKQSDFLVDLNSGGQLLEGIPMPNWREGLLCPSCGLNQRSRSAMKVVASLVPHAHARAWIAERVTPLYQNLKWSYPFLIGSEFVSADMNSGTLVSQDGIGQLRHEDCTSTSFADSSLEVVLSFDVMEHIPAYTKAMEEAWRVLQKEGVFIWSAPFNLSSPATSVRAVLLDDGTVQHILPPEYHGDPMSPGGGILCYRHFGWQILNELKAVGFASAFILGELSPADGCLFNSYIVAIK